MRFFTSALRATLAMGFAAILALFWSSATWAYDCPGPSNTGLSFGGTVVGQNKDAGTLIIDTSQCGKVSVTIPAQTQEELERYLRNCEIGAFVAVKGNGVERVLEATSLSCL